jgi:hypothetical protein
MELCTLFFRWTLCRSVFRLGMRFTGLKWENGVNQYAMIRGYRQKIIEITFFLEIFFRILPLPPSRDKHTVYLSIVKFAKD